MVIGYGNAKSPTEQKGTWLEAWTSNNFDTLSKKKQWSATENNLANIWIDQMLRKFWIIALILSVVWDFSTVAYKRAYYTIGYYVFICEIEMYTVYLVDKVYPSKEL